MNRQTNRQMHQQLYNKIRTVYTYDQSNEAYGTKSIKNEFEQRHPKVPLFLQAVSGAGIAEGTVIELSVTSPDGQNYCSNIRVTAEDLKLIETLKQMR